VFVFGQPDGPGELANHLQNFATRTIRKNIDHFFISLGDSQIL